MLAEVAAAGMQLSRSHPGKIITDRLHAVACVMGVTEQTARRYIDDAAVIDLARNMLFELIQERPGADLLDTARTARMPLILLGRSIAALAEAMQVRSLNEPAEDLEDVVSVFGQTFSALGQMIAACGDGPPDEAIAAPPALLHRLARYLDVAAELIDAGANVPVELSPADRRTFSATLRQDAAGLRALASP